jgi:hypothetical protein
MRSPGRAAAGQLGEEGRDGLGDAVDQVRAHGVAAVDVDVNDDQPPSGRRGG